MGCGACPLWANAMPLARYLRRRFGFGGEVMMMMIEIIVVSAYAYIALFPLLSSLFVGDEQSP